jgi:hypothetical protein
LVAEVAVAQERPAFGGHKAVVVAPLLINQTFQLHLQQYQWLLVRAATQLQHKD